MVLFELGLDKLAVAQVEVDKIFFKETPKNKDRIGGFSPSHRARGRLGCDRTGH